MDIPNYLNSPIADKDGYLTPEWSNIMSQLLTELQLNLSNEGYKLPQLTSDQITMLQSIAAMGPSEASKSNSNMFYDITTNDEDAARIFINGVLYKFTLTPV